MTFERTADLNIVYRMLTQPKCWRRMKNDDAPEVSMFRVQPSDIQYVMAHAHGMVAALFLLKPLLAGSAEVHFCFTPESWGYTESIAEGFLGWTWANTSLVRLVGPVPAYNRLALRLARAVGFQESMREYGCVSKGGKKYDRITLAISRPEGM